MRCMTRIHQLAALTLLFAGMTSFGEEPQEVPLGEVAAGLHDRRIVKVRGWLRNVLNDELDPKFLFMVLNDGTNSICLVTREREKTDAFRALTGSEILATGRCNPLHLGSRQLMDTTMEIKLGSLSVLGKAPSDPFEVPDLFENRERIRVNNIVTLGPRRTAGRVLAVWKSRNLLVRTKAGDIVRAELADRNPPAPGSAIEIVGTPETDLNNLNLSGARWRASNEVLPPEPPAERTSAEFLLTDGKGNQMIKAS